MNILLKEFGVNSHKELVKYMKNNPQDKKVMQLQEILEMFRTSQKKAGGEYEK